jgi:hypothetical protein
MSRRTRSGRRSAVDRRTTCHPGYAVSQHTRNRIEGGVRWAKKAAGLSRMRHRGLPKADWQFTPAMAAFDLLNCSLRMFGYPAYRSDHVTFAPHNSQLIGATLARNRSVIIADTEGR